MIAATHRAASAAGRGAADAKTQPFRPPHPASSQPKIDQTASRVNAGAEIVPGLYRLTDIRDVNVYLWMPRPSQSTPGETILFDCGWPWSGRSLAASLEGLGCPIDDIRTLAITHADFDHVGPLAALADESRFEILAHESEAPRLAYGQWRTLPGTGGSLDPVILLASPFYRRWPARPVKITRPFRDREEIGDGWIAIHTPGHTPGHTAFYRAASRVLIAGDALGSMRNQQIRLPKRIYAEDWTAALRSVRKLADLEPDVICFGHGRELHQATGFLHALAKSLPSEYVSGGTGGL